jgi:hypothetical protein
MVEFAFSEHIAQVSGNNGLVALEYSGDLVEA